MDAKVVCQEYSSSLEDLTFNSKPLINMLTMLAEENSQHAADIVKLIEKRIYEVTIDKKLPSLYLMDSIIKNIGKDYLTTVVQCIVALFTHVFEKGDEKVRMSLYKLRNTWPPVFPAMKLHEIDCSVHKLDPGWPVVDPPPTSPSIHINPKFLPKVEEKIDDPQAARSSTGETKLLKDFEKMKEQLEHLQGEQLRLQMQELTELQLKHDLIKKKQEQERQELIKQQQQRILEMKLREENIENKADDGGSPDASTQQVVIKRDPRLEKQIHTTSKEKTVSAEDREPKKAEIPSKHETVKKPEHVGFDSEFVPLDKSKDVEETPPDSAYNRDRPLGKKRYFNKDSNTRDDNTEHASANNNTEPKHRKLHESSWETSRGGKRRELHHRENVKPSGNLPFQKRHNQDDPKSRRRAEDGERKERPFRGRERADRVRIRGRRRNEMAQRVRVGSSENEEFSDGVPGKLKRHEDWNRGRGRKRVPRGHPGAGRGEVHSEREMRNRHEFPPPMENNDRLVDRPGPNWPADYTFERGILGEPPSKKNRGSSPRPLFSEEEMSEIRSVHRDSPPHGFQPGPPHEFDPRQNPPDWHNQKRGFEQELRPRWRPEQQHEMGRPEFFGQRFPGDVRRPRFPHPEIGHPREGFPPEHFPLGFHRHPHNFAGGVEIPLELTLDNESEILKSAHRRLSTGDLSEEQHRELVEKLHQLYELQKWQRRHSVENLARDEREIQHPQLHPPEGLRPDIHPPEQILVHQGHLPNPPMENMVFDAPLPNRQFEFYPPPQSVVGDAQPVLLVQPDQPLPANSDQPLNTINNQSDVIGEVPPSNLVMEKQTVDDLFKRLMDFGIITKINQQAAEGTVRTLTPPPVPQVQEIPIPEITLKLDDLRRRYDGVIVMLYRGTQCSSCGLRFKETDNENYRQHLDWHFRMNRREKETVAAHRNWFITEDDWLEFESSEDPKLKARSTVFEAESDHESENSEEGAERSCPVLREDTESESTCDICLEKFEQFWDETSEDWHYKSAVRIDGKTYHYLCYQDAGEAEDDAETLTDDGDAEQYENDELNAGVLSEARDDRQENEGGSKETSLTNDNTASVTENTELIVGGESGENDTNKEEKKIECS